MHFTWSVTPTMPELGQSGKIRFCVILKRIKSAWIQHQGTWSKAQSAKVSSNPEEMKNHRIASHFSHFSKLHKAVELRHVILKIRDFMLDLNLCHIGAHLIGHRPFPKYRRRSQPFTGLKPTKLKEILNLARLEDKTY